MTATLVPVYVSSSRHPQPCSTAPAARTILALVKQYSAPLDTEIKVDGDVGYVRAGKK